MSYKQNLGRVKGESGTSYVPRIVEGITNNIPYVKVEWEAHNDTNPPNTIEGDLFPLVYIPVIDENTGDMRFTLSRPTSYSFTLPKAAFQGATGEDGHLATHIVSDFESLPTGDQIDTDAIYVAGDGNCYIWDSTNTPHDWITIENLIKFEDYYTKNQVYKKYDATDVNNSTYNAGAIDNKIGDAQAAIQQINNILNNGSINIQMDND